MHWANLQLLDEKMEVLSRGLGVVLAGPAGRVTEATQVDGKDAMALRKQWDELPKRPPSFGKAVDEQDRRSRSTC